MLYKHGREETAGEAGCVSARLPRVGRAHRRSGQARLRACIKNMKSNAGLVQGRLSGIVRRHWPGGARAAPGPWFSRALTGAVRRVESHPRWQRPAAALAAGAQRVRRRDVGGRSQIARPRQARCSGCGCGRSLRRQIWRFPKRRFRCFASHHVSPLRRAGERYEGAIASVCSSAARAFCCRPSPHAAASSSNRSAPCPM